VEIGRALDNLNVPGEQAFWQASVAGRTAGSTSRRELARRVGLVSFADLSAVLLRQVQDDSGEGHGAELERDEHEVAAVDGNTALDMRGGRPPPSRTAAPRRDFLSRFACRVF
jgi:hypothetical protein